MDEKELLRIEHLSVWFTQYQGLFSRVKLPVIRDLQVQVQRGEIVAIVGASGSGKSLLAHAVMGLLPGNALVGGAMYYKGELLTEKRKKALRGREIFLTPQSVSFLNPLMKVGEQLRQGKKDQESRKKSLVSLEKYGLERETENLYPFQLSGGMARRVLIATTEMGEPNLVIADEPTPGLHIEAAFSVMEHFREMARQGAGVLLITHDLELAVKTADRIVVFYAGMSVEEALSEDFKKEESLRHPYSRALYRAMPEHGFQASEGVQPYVKNLPPGCPYEPRCPLKTRECREEIDFRKWRGGRVRCICPGKG